MGRIDVDICSENGMLVITVTDNGVGNHGEKLESLLSGSSSYGLKNVKQRILIFSGPSVC
jgi:sensor histidine kinase YesM